MSLTTRCPDCGTTFKVVVDQLKVSQGWVRCGQCAEVFDASLYLQVDRPASPPAVPAETVAPSFPASPPPPTPLTETADALPVQAMLSEATIATEPGYLPEARQLAVPSSRYASRSAANFKRRSQSAGESSRLRISDPSPSRRSRQRDRDREGPESSRFDPLGWLRRSVAPHDKAEPHPELPSRKQADGVPAAPALTLTPDFDHSQDSPLSFAATRPVEGAGELPELTEVSFVRDARRQAVWRKPFVRGVLGLLSGVLLALLVVQMAVQHRSSLATYRPELKPALQTLCSYLQCDIGPLQRIESVVIDSSSFNKTSADEYRLSFSLKNTSTAPLAMPSLEVTLTDSQDQALIRRVLTPAQFGAMDGLLNTGPEFSAAVAIKVTAPGTVGLHAAPGRVAGYRMLVFYP